MLQTASHQSMEVTNEIPTAGTSNSNERMNQRDKTPRPPRNRFRNAQRSTGSPTGRTNGDQASSNRPITPPRGDANTTVRSGSSNIGSGVPPVTGSEGVPAPRKRNPRKRNPVQTPADTPESSNTERSKDGGGTRQNRLAGGERGTRRGAKFNAGLTDPSSTAHNQSTDKPANRYRNKAHTINPLPTDLASTLIQALRTPPYPDCPICFSSIHPAQRTWSCSPSIPVIRPADAESDEQQYCWTTFHVKCIGEWASKSVTEVAKAWRARGEEGKKGDWRCPGCQAKREIVPSGYWCFCNSTAEPKPPRLATPHSCANPCSRIRESGCGHACPLACHPGPCPPCQVTTRLECYCLQKKVIAFKCGVDQGKGTKSRGRNLSCGSVCGRKLGCGKHTCERVCHEGACNDCSVRDIARCWCGCTEMEIACGEGQEILCVDSDGKAWIGRFGCAYNCQKLFDCGLHKCEQACHPPHEPTLCPLSPSVITTCPCGTHPIAPPSSSSVPKTTPTTFPSRQHCTSPIPTCTSLCGKTQPGCEHACAARCHTGPCPPCSVSLVRPCRCGGTTRNVRCFELRPPVDTTEEWTPDTSEILCDKPCMALRACGRHQCRRLCCPLAALASGAGKKGKKRGGAVDLGTGVGEEQGGLHECDLVCGKMLGCGNHPCEERDHRGACPPCLRSSFEEMICYCGQTVLEPPIPCGTQIQCNYQCPRPPPPCGHPRTQHTCHEEPSLCPPCPFLATKSCACGKKMVGNVRCSLENDKVSCGTTCGKLMACGFHHCERPCHGDDCGACTAPCGKSRKNCLPAHHPCTRPCHAPSTCLEDEPCQSLVSLTCSCGRIRQSVHCHRSIACPDGPQQLAPKCNNECSIAKRNARLAEALGINAESREKAANVTYHDELVAFARINAKFLGVVEKALAEFVTSQKKTQVLPHMPPERRKFVHDLAGIYRMDTQMVDQEPHRSVRLLRRTDTRIPTPLLSTIMTTATAPTSLGKLADLRSGNTSSWRTSPIPSSSKATIPGRSAGWASARPPVPTPAGSPKPSSSSSATAGSSVQTPPSVLNTATPETVPDDWEDDA